jgi:hypothetical protein
VIEPLELVPERLWALPLPFALDRPRSMFPVRPGSFGTGNCYLLREGDRALLVDTGFPCFHDDVLGLLARVLAPSTVLSVIVLRPAEVSSLGNLFSVLEEYEVETLHAALAHDIVHSFDVRSLARRNPGGLRPHGYRQLTQSQTLALGPGRPLEVFKPMLQLLNQLWIYDERTRTLFTSEYFGYTMRPGAAGPWTVTDTADAPAPDALAGFLRDGNRTWWLAGADGERLASWVAETFASRPVDCIAPAFGAIFRGREVVERQAELMQQALRGLAREQAVPAA